MMRDICKWPCLIATGKKVTRGQAEEIILRTSSFPYFHTNDHEWRKNFHKLFGLGEDGLYGSVDVCRQLSDAVKILNLDYLTNSRIVSSHINGPHGWMNQDGTIFSNNYNIGKYPTRESVEKEAILIAREFPYLDMSFYIMAKETGEEDNFPLLQLKISNGKMEPIDGNISLDIPPQQDSSEKSVLNLLFRGATSMEVAMSPEKVMEICRRLSPISFQERSSSNEF